jgi:RNA polymerase sigma-54 factor
MPIEMKQQLRLSQQLVMTPQLQQAIKLLQLSRLELCDIVRTEMNENPVLEDVAETAQEQPRQESEVQREENSLSGETETAAPQSAESREDAAEVGGETSAVNQIDWENYLDAYSMAGRPPSMRAQSEELPSIEATLTRRSSLYDHLEWQLRLANFEEDEERVGLMIIGNLDPDGYLKEPSLAEIAQDAAVPFDVAEAVLRRIQEFDPVGVGARSLSECLLIQAKHIGADDEIVVRMLTDHIHHLEKKNYAAIAKDLRQPLDEVYEAAKAIMALDPRPGRAYTDEEPLYITPDVYVHKLGDKYFVVPNDDGLPKLKISSFYRTALHGSPQAREYIQDKLRSAQWLIRSIQQRQRTIIKVTESIIKFQREFFDKGIGHLKPLILRDVADDISMHESTISRVTTNKYVHTPQGIFELKFFFNSGISRTNGDEIASESVKDKIRQIIGGEDGQHPLSDQAIVEKLKADHGIDIARRTVAKYREQLGVLSSSKRRQVF